MFLIDEIRDLVRRRELISHLVWSEIKISYRTKMLGFLWAVLDPFFMMLVYVILVRFIFQRGGPDYPILLFSSLLSFRWLSSAMSTSVKVLPAHLKLIQSIQFPYSALPVARVLIALFNYLLGLLVLIPMLFFFDAKLTPHVMWMLLLIPIQFVFTTGCAMIASVMGIFFRDLENILIFALRIWLYLSPVLFPLSLIPDRWQLPYLVANPMAPLLHAYRNVLIYGEAPGHFVFLTLGYALIALFLGFYLFHKKQRSFARAL